MVIILLFTYTICPFIQTYSTELDTAQNEATDAEKTKAEESQNEEGAETTDNTALFDSAGVMVSAPSAILMEASTGTIIYEKDSKEQLRPASITKIMTLILIFDALDAGKISLDDTVTVSEYAASMGGSQVFLEPGEEQTVDTMIKCIAVASANDACVAMAEYICGSETEFVNQMNERAQGLGMTNTHFANCNGLDTDGHVTSAYDVALMSRELIVKYPQIHDYSTIWMENITHVTKKGSSEFGLTNTNKLIKQYEYATGLKTGSTSLAKYCVSATAKKNDIELIAVIMAAPDYKIRFQDATTLLNFGYGKCQVYSDDNQETLPQISVKKGIERTVSCEYENTFKYLDVTGADLSAVEKEMQLANSANAPITKGDLAGKMIYKLNGKEIGYTKILYTDSVDEAVYMDYFMRTVKLFTL
ncbi:D-alanyl-D-alanine carboxypeptidase [Lachnotalea glycerini]|nr:D-alanyl-D-alanine carboxypeptidase [Lachnotalea glycerini]